VVVGTHRLLSRDVCFNQLWAMEDFLDCLSGFTRDLGDLTH
jgi:hypothetical protein